MSENSFVWIAKILGEYLSVVTKNNWLSCKHVHGVFHPLLKEIDPLMYDYLIHLHNASETYVLTNTYFSKIIMVIALSLFLNLLFCWYNRWERTSHSDIFILQSFLF